MSDPDQSKSDVPERQPSSTSLHALDGLNFFLADVRDGMGPFLGTFLREHQHWDAGLVGIALASSQIGTVLAQTPAGALIDSVRWKRLAVAIAAALVAVGCVLLYLVPTPIVVVAAQTVIGAAAAVFPPAVAALTLGLVGRAAMPRRTGKNEAYNHGGNLIAAALAGASAYFFGYGAMFYLVAAMAAASAAAVLLIREKEIDHDLARGADDGEGDGHEAISIRELFKDRRITIFATSVVLFHLANAAMLPLVGQKSSDGLKEGAAVLMSACIIAAQVVMVPVALVASRLAVTLGPQAGLPDRLRGPARSRPALLPQRQPILPRRRPAPRRHRRGNLRGRLGTGRGRSDEGDRPVQPDARGTRHGDRDRCRPEQPPGGLRGQGGGLRRRLHHARGDRRCRGDLLRPGHARDPRIGWASWLKHRRSTRCRQSLVPIFLR